MSKNNRYENKFSQRKKSNNIQLIIAYGYLVYTSKTPSDIVSCKSSLDLPSCIDDKGQIYLATVSVQPHIHATTRISNKPVLFKSLKTQRKCIGI